MSVTLNLEDMVGVGGGGGVQGEGRSLTRWINIFSKNIYHIFFLCFFLFVLHSASLDL